MKKIIILLIGIVISLFPKSIYASEAIIDWQLDTSIHPHKIYNGEESVGNLAYLTANGEISYCIQPGTKALKEGVYTVTNNILDTPVSDNNLKKLSLIGYYGYTYPNHQTKEYYMATQELIWELMGYSSVWWTDDYENEINIEYYKNDILRLVNNYEKAPSFNFSDKYIVGEEIVINDDNNILSEYELERNYENISIEENSIKIKFNEKNNFTLRRKKNNGSIKFYYKLGYQTLGSFTSTYDFSKEYSVDALYGKIELEKKDYDTKTNSPISYEAKIEGAKYGLYDKNDNLIIEKETDNEGKIVFDKLTKDDYYIKEIIPSAGYTLDENKYFVNVDEELKKIISYEKIIKNKILITKVLDDTKNGIMICEPNIEFGIYDINNNLIKKYKTNDKGMLEFYLPYGKYILKQLTRLKNISVVDDTIIDANKDGEVKNIVLVNYKLEEKLPNTGKHINIFVIILIQAILLILYKYENKNN